MTAANQSGPPTEPAPGQPLPGLPGLLGITLATLGQDRVQASLTLTDAHLVPDTNTVHAAAVVALADTACGYGARANLPPGAVGFTTVELSCHHLGTAHAGERLAVTAVPAHLGRSTQVWDATVTTDAAGRAMALFRCVQLVLHPAPGSAP